MILDNTGSRKQLICSTKSSTLQMEGDHVMKMMPGWRGPAATHFGPITDCTSCVHDSLLTFRQILSLEDFYVGKKE
jgi:hypothetical protein